MGYAELFLSHLIALPTYESTLAGPELPPEGLPILEAVRRLAGGPVDLDALLGEIERLGARRPEVERYLQDLYGLVPLDPDPAELHYYEVRLREDHARALLLVRLAEIQRNGRHPATRLAAVVEEVRRALDGVEESATNLEAPTVDVMLRRREETPAPTFPCGITFLDERLGGMQRHHVWVINAGYKQRKTTLALNMVHHVLAGGGSVAYITSEGTDVEFVEAILGLHARLDSRAFSKLPKPKTWARVLPGAGKYQAQKLTQKQVEEAAAEGWRWIRAVGDRLRIYDPGRHSNQIGSLPGLIRADTARFGTHLVVVDYVQAFAATQEYRALADVAATLLRVASREPICLLQLSQMDNEAIKEGALPNYLATKGAGDFGAHCHVGLQTLWNPEPNRKSDAELGVWLKIARHASPVRLFSGIDPASGWIFNDWHAEPLYYREPRAHSSRYRREGYGESATEPGRDDIFSDVRL